MDKFAVLFLSVVIMCITIFSIVCTSEVQKTNRTFIENGLTKQYDSNVSGWIKK